MIFDDNLVNSGLRTKNINIKINKLKMQNVQLGRLQFYILHFTFYIISLRGC